MIANIQGGVSMISELSTRAFNSPKTRKTSTGRMTPVFFCQIFCFYI